MSERFYMPDCRSGETLCLEGDEAAHLAKVMRARPGDRIILFDGRGREYDAEMTEKRGTKVRLRVGNCREISRMPPFEMTISAATPKGHRMDHLVELCAAYGVRRLIPMDTARSVAAALQAGDEKQARWRRIAVETAKQCGRNLLMDITPMRFADVLAVPDPSALKLIAVKNGNAQPAREVLPAEAPVMALVGPEGGFTGEEVARAKAANFAPVSLGEATLRIEHAAAALAALAALGLSDRS